MLKTLFAAATLAALSAPCAFAADDAFKYLSGADAAASVASPKGDAPAINYLSKHPDFVEEIIQRSKSGEVEIHDKVNDYMVVMDGHATITIGGIVANKKQTAPGEWRAPSSTGGKVYSLHPGAMLIIPAGLPHWMQLPAGGHLRYVTVKGLK